MKKQPQHHKDQRLTELVQHLVAEYVSRESNRTSLITVTAAVISDKFQRVTVFITVMPESYEEAALTFLRRQVNEIREYIRTRARIGVIPFLTFELDKGEKNRQHIDDISRSL